MGEQMQTNSNFEPMVRNLNRHQRRTVEATQGIRILSKEKKIELAEGALVEEVKNNMAEKVIDNFVASLAGLPLAARLRFCLGIIFNK
ncbi:hypothetical protein CCP3SC15_1070003 [Gammaproteobacteria bacterium]